MPHLPFNILCLKLPCNEEGFNLRGHFCLTYGHLSAHCTTIFSYGQFFLLGGVLEMSVVRDVSKTYGEDFRDLLRTLDFTMTDIESYLRVLSLLDRL